MEAETWVCRTLSNPNGRPTVVFKAPDIICVQITSNTSHWQHASPVRDNRLLLPQLSGRIVRCHSDRCCCCCFADRTRQLWCLTFVWCWQSTGRSSGRIRPSTIAGTASAAQKCLPSDAAGHRWLLSADSRPYAGRRRRTASPGRALSRTDRTDADSQGIRPSEIQRWRRTAPVGPAPPPLGRCRRSPMARSWTSAPTWLGAAGQLMSLGGAGRRCRERRRRSGQRSAAGHLWSAVGGGTVCGRWRDACHYRRRRVACGEERRIGGRGRSPWSRRIDGVRL